VKITYSLLILFIISIHLSLSAAQASSSDSAPLKIISRQEHAFQTSFETTQTSYRKFIASELQRFNAEYAANLQKLHTARVPAVTTISSQAHFTIQTN
jgi:hypothetical protein